MNGSGLDFADCSSDSDSCLCSEGLSSGSERKLGSDANKQLEHSSLFFFSCLLQK